MGTEGRVEILVFEEIALHKQVPKSTFKHFLTNPNPVFTFIRGYRIFTRPSSKGSAFSIWQE